MKCGIATLVLLMFEGVLTGAGSAQVAKNGHVAMYILPQPRAEVGIDYANAKPLPLPVAAIRPISQAPAIRTAPDPLMLFGAPQVSPGSEGSGKEALLQLTPPKQLHRQDGAAPEFGTAQLPFTTSRVNAADHLTVKFSPFRAAGKLFFKNGAESLFCSAALIKRGLVVTAAHCIALYGKYYYDHFEFVPAYDNGAAPYGRWSFVVVAVPQAYFDGKDGCAEAGVICPDDVAILTVRPHGSVFPGDSTGWFAYALNDYGFTVSGQALISELGYPTLLDRGELMERTDAQGSIVRGLSKNTVIGSLMTNRSGGGPWLVNLGVAPHLSAGFLHGRGADRNVVVGVTSWTTPDRSARQQGSSPFTADNIQRLVDGACAFSPEACGK
jgi:hypothetical protein